MGFAGTPALAAKVLSAILAAGFDVPLVVTRPDAPQGRGLKVSQSTVKTLALSRGLNVVHPTNLRDAPNRELLTAHSVDVLVVAAYGLILPAPLLKWPRHGCINVHASLLPRWRGAAPIPRALLEGDVETGVSIMQMDPGLDTGAVIATQVVPIGARETAGTLTDKLSAAGGASIVVVLSALKRDGHLDAWPQEPTGVTYAPKIERGETIINWTENAVAIDRRIRAFDPAPGASTLLRGESIKIWRAQPAAGRFGSPGSVIRAGSAGIVVACGDGALVVLELQRAGGKRLSAAAFLAGRPLANGALFGG